MDFTLLAPGVTAADRVFLDAPTETNWLSQVISTGPNLVSIRVCNFFPGPADPTKLTMRFTALRMPVAQQPTLLPLRRR